MSVSRAGPRPVGAVRSPVDPGGTHAGRRPPTPRTTPASGVIEGHDDLFGTNVLLVTGKGGVGKTTTAAALGLAAADSGRDTLLVEVEGRDTLSRAFATTAWDYQEREFRPGLWGVSLDPAEAVYEYLELFYGLRRVQWMMERSHALDFVTTAAPGLRDLLLIGKVYEIEARRRADGRRLFDTIIVDAPPTGRIVPFLQSPSAVTEIVRMGPIRRQSGQIEAMLTDPSRCRALVVTLLEEMPVTEAAEGIVAMAAAGVASGPVVANQVVVPAVTAEQAEVLCGDPAPVRDVAAGVGLDLDDHDLAGLTTMVSDHRVTVARQRRLAARLQAGTGRDLLVLPDLAADTFDVDALHVLADTIARQVGADGPTGLDVAGIVAEADSSEGGR
jgi:Mrp family chromosome partitioning ATPase